MKITIKKEQIKIKLKDFPTKEELEILNSYHLGNYFICEKRGYKRLLVQTGAGAKYLVMECPIGETFIM